MKKFIKSLLLIIVFSQVFSSCKLVDIVPGENCLPILPVLYVNHQVFIDISDRKTNNPIANVTVEAHIYRITYNSECHEQGNYTSNTYTTGIDGKFIQSFNYSYGLEGDYMEIIFKIKKVGYTTQETSLYFKGTDKERWIHAYLLPTELYP